MNGEERNTTNFSIQLTVDKCRRFLTGGHGRKLVNYTDELYDVLRDHWLTCPLTFKNNYIWKRRVDDKLKWSGKACCTADKRCIIVNFSSLFDDTFQSAAVAAVTVHGNCTHQGRVQGTDSTETQAGERSKRKLRSRIRQEVAQQVVQSIGTPTDLYIRKLGQMNESELRAGNVTHCQSPDDLKKAHSELQQSTQLHRDTMCLTAEAYRSAIIRLCIDGYIQQLGFIPFVCIFYMEEQAEAYINQYKDDQPCSICYTRSRTVVLRTH